jgi:hypothetical protein
MSLDVADLAVLEWLCAHGPGVISAREIGASVGLLPVTVEVCLHALEVEGMICRWTWPNDTWSGRYVIGHIQPGQGPREMPLTEEAPGGP